MNPKSHLPENMARKMGHELKGFAIISAYLYICFGAVLFYKSAILHAYGVDYEPYGLALVKSLILAKFIMIGDVFHMHKAYKRKPLVYSLILKSFIYLVFLVLLSAIEEAFVGVVHGRSVVAAVSEIGGGTWPQLLATCVLLWLIIVPFVAIRQINEVIGDGQLQRIFFVAR